MQIWLAVPRAGTAAKGSPCCTVMPAVLASPRFQGVSAGFRDVSRDRNSLLDSNGLRRPSATASGLWMKLGNERSSGR
jgi:hypothetical protein